MMVLGSGEVLERCQSVSSDYWQCDYRAEGVWQQVASAGTTSNYILPALTLGVVEPLLCAVALVVLRVAAVSVVPDPRAFTFVVNACVALLVEEDE